MRLYSRAFIMSYVNKIIFVHVQIGQTGQQTRLSLQFIFPSMSLQYMTWLHSPCSIKNRPTLPLRNAYFFVYQTSNFLVLGHVLTQSQPASTQPQVFYMITKVILPSVILRDTSQTSHHNQSISLTERTQLVSANRHSTSNTEESSLKAESKQSRWHSDKLVQHVSIRGDSILQLQAYVLRALPFLPRGPLPAEPHQRPATAQRLRFTI